jgi:hypothetical protein
MATTSLTSVGNSADSRRLADVTPCIATANAGAHLLPEAGAEPTASRRLFGPLHGLSLGHAEDRQLQAPPNGKQPERNHHHHAGPKRPRTLQPKRLQEQVESDTHDCGSGVEVSPQDEGHLRRDDIPQDPSGYQTAS